MHGIHMESLEVGTTVFPNEIFCIFDIGKGIYGLMLAAFYFC